MTHRPNPLLSFMRGALLTLLLTAPLVASLLLAHVVLGIPFIPYDVFDLVSRSLPGSVVTSGIDAMVGILTALGLSVRDTAKVAEQGMAVGLTLFLAMIGGGLFFVFWRGRRSSLLSGSLYGLVTGAILALVSATRPNAVPLQSLWVLLALLVWGVGLAWVQRHTVRTMASATGSAERVNRRQFMVRMGGAAALITVAGAGVGSLLGRRQAEAEAATGQRWSAMNPLPNAGATAQPVPGTRPEYTPLEQYYRIDINLTPPTIDEATWNLRVEGLLDTPKTYTLAELRTYEPVSQFITMACISNPVGGELTSTTRWTGVPLRRLLPEWGLQPDATHLRIASVDGFFEYVALTDIENDERIMLAYAWDGVPLRIRNGFPLRVYIPDHYGMKQPKWIESIEAVPAWEPGYWVRRTWDKTAQMRATSVIDTVQMGEGEPVSIGGMAHAGARGISKVEVKVDDGPWQEAELREPISELTWVLWRFEWPFEEGEHTFNVRCFEGDGTPQITERRSPHPSGSTGIDGRQVTL